MLITPGQGILSLLIGVYLLADEIPLFGRIKRWLELRFPKTADYVHRKDEQLKAKFNRDKTTNNETQPRTNTEEH